HIPKTAGTSFREVIQKLYKDDICYDYTDNYNLSDYVKPSMKMKMQRKWHYRKFRQKLKDTDKCIYGHFRVSKYQSLDNLNEVTFFLREPTERLISHYYYWKKNPDPLNYVCKELIENDLSLENFAKLPLVQNFQSKFVGNTPISDFSFIGITEKFDQCIESFCDLHGITSPDLERKMVNKDKTPLKDISPKVLEKIRSLNTIDLRLYEEAMELAIKKNII
ncbi:sulfotransferase family 2 domain-containing protein, partial [Leeuwenhoekiella blandensis]